jgi:prepilin-type N-terminal cleavage/methylation domain-containing protein
MDETDQRRREADRGFSVVEVVITIALLGIVVVPIMDAVYTSIRASSSSRSSAQVETALVNAADRVNRAPKSCDYTLFAQAAVQTQGWAPDRASLTHRRYVPGATPAAPGTWVDGACEIPPNPKDGEVQLVTITITSPDGKVSRQIQVVKSDV